MSHQERGYHIEASETAEFAERARKTNPLGQGRSLSSPVAFDVAFRVQLP